MKELTHPSLSVAAVVEDLQRIARRLMTISEDGVARGMTHTNGVDCLIGLVDRMDFACGPFDDEVLYGKGDSPTQNKEVPNQGG